MSRPSPRLSWWFGRPQGAGVAALTLVAAVLAPPLACGGGAGGGGGGGAGGGGGGGGSAGAAGAGGGGEGGTTKLTPCETYCAAIGHLCEGAYQQFGGPASCEAFCALLPEGADADYQTNLQSVACRRHHLDESAGDPATHCEHAGPAGGGACGSPCGAYCLAVADACPSLYVDDAACQGSCATWPQSIYSTDAEALGGFACHLANALRALLDPLHCEAAGPASPVCN